MDKLNGPIIFDLSFVPVMGILISVDTPLLTLASKDRDLDACSVSCCYTSSHLSWLIASTSEIAIFARCWHLYFYEAVTSLAVSHRQQWHLSVSTEPAQTLHSDH